MSNLTDNSSNRGQYSGKAENIQQIPWMTQLKSELSLKEIASSEGYALNRRGDKYFICCPEHSEKTPSCVISRYGYKCFGCGAKGNLYAFIRAVHPYMKDDKEAFEYLRQNYGQGINFSNRKSPASLRTGVQKEIVNEPVLKKESLLFSFEDLMNYHQKFISGEGYERERAYALRRGWFPADLCGVGLYPLGVIPASEKEKSFLSEHNALCFPKLIQTRRLAMLYGAENEFDRRVEEGFCIGFKKRLLPDTLRAFARYVKDKFGDNAKNNDLRWLWQAGASAKIPWEFDANENAPVLFVTEGPGDGLRLFYEAHRDAVRHAEYGSRWHITSTDAAAMWCESEKEEMVGDTDGNNSEVSKKLVVSSTALPIRELEDGKKLTFFDNYKHIILILDPDKTGQAAAQAIAEYAVSCNKSAKVRNLVLPEGKDLCQFFDDGYTLEELSDMIADSPVFERQQPSILTETIQSIGHDLYQH